MSIKEPHIRKIVSLHRKILISFIGKSDPYTNRSNDINGPFISAFDEIKPDLVVLLISGNDIQKNATETIDFLKELRNFPETSIYKGQLDLDDPTDYNALYTQLQKYLNQLRKDFQQLNIRPDYHISISSGTQQMSLVLTSIIEENFFPNVKMYAIRDPRYLKHNQHHIYQIERNYILETVALRELPYLIETLQFEMILDKLRDIEKTTAIEQRKEKSTKLIHLFTCLMYLDRLLFDEAMKHVKFTEDLLPPAQYDRWKATLESLQHATETNGNPALLFELYESAERRIDKYDWVGSLTRLWHLWELLLTHILKHQYGIDTNKLTNSTHKDNLDSLQKWLKKDKTNDKNSIFGWKKKFDILTNLFQYKPLLDWLKEKIEHRSKKRSFEKWIWLIQEARNQSIAAHGIKPVQPENVKVAKKLLQNALDKFTDGNRSDYPFTIDKLKGLIKLVEDL